MHPIIVTVEIRVARERESRRQGDRMADENTFVPVWTLATEAVPVPDLVDEADMTPERLADLRTALATFAQAPSRR